MHGEQYLNGVVVSRGAEFNAFDTASNCDADMERHLAVARADINERAIRSKLQARWC